MMRYILIGCCFFCSLFLSSCNSTKRLGQTATQTSQLSHQLGFKVNRKDDLRLFSEAARWLGTPYRYGSSTRKGVDCSGLVNQTYKQVYHRSLERSSSGIATRNCRKIMKSDLSSGDLVFFNTSRKKRKGINHERKTGGAAGRHDPQGKIIRSSLFVLNNSHFMFKN